MIHLQRYIEDKSNKAEDRAEGKGILKKVMQYKLIWFLHFMRDILMKLQSSRCNPSKLSIMSKVQSVQLALREMMDNSGCNLQMFQDELKWCCLQGTHLNPCFSIKCVDSGEIRITQELHDYLDSTCP